MEEKIALLEQENDQFIDREAQMRRVNTQLRYELDALRNTLSYHAFLCKRLRGVSNYSYLSSGGLIMRDR